MVSEQDTGFARFAKKAGVAGKLNDGVTMQRAIQWIEQQSQADTPFCLVMNLQTTHFPYEVPHNWNAPFEPARIDFSASFLDYPKDKVSVVRNAYYNGLHYVDQQVGKLISFLEKSGLRDQTIVIVAGDNGESFYEHDQPTHGGLPFEPQVNVALVMNCPTLLAPEVDDYLTQMIDLPPTILGLQNLRPHPCFQGIDVLAENRPPQSERLVFIHCQTGRTQSDAVISGTGWKCIHDRRSQRTWLFNLYQDPGEASDQSTQNRKAAEILMQQLQEWRRRQLVYYQTPGYYGWFYPPPTPRLATEQRQILESTLINP